MILLEFIEKIAQKSLQHPHEFFKAGHNGPYMHPETETRYKAHWLITFCKLYAWTGSDVYKNKAAEFAEYLLGKEARPHGFSFYHRNAPKKDRCNGLVGQAWTFEALAQASQTFKDERFNKLAQEVFLQHHFNKKHALWNILEINGKHLPIDIAFNHQLWFAAGIAQVENLQPEIQRQIHLFLDHLFTNVTMVGNGLIYHEYVFEPEDRYAKKQKAGLKAAVKQSVRRLLHGKSKKRSGLSPLEKKEQLWDKMKYKSIGYQAFNTYAFALLKEKLPTHAIWQHEQLKAAVNYFFEEEYAQGIEGNTFGFPYNPPGFEIPYSLQLLKPEMEEAAFYASSEHWLNRQLEACYNPDTGMFDKNNVDPATLTARIYEIIRLDVKALKHIKVKDTLL